MLPANVGNNISDTMPILHKDVRLIGDQTANTITVPEGNTSIYSYTIGEPVGRELNPKTLKILAPCEYDNEGNIISTTWLTFNSYTASEWLNGYHLLGNQWNNIGSP